VSNPYQRWLTAKDRWRKREGGQLKPSDEIATELRASIVETLRLVARGDTKMPGDMAFELADAIEAIEASQDATFLLPVSLKLAVRKQARAHPFLEGLRRDAVNYLHLVKLGKIEDHRPIHTVSLTYGVDRRTVYRWQKKFAIEEDTLLHVEPSLVKEIFHASGKQYQKPFEILFQKT